MPPTLSAFPAWLMLAAMVVGSGGSPPTALPVATAMLDGVITGIADVAQWPGVQSVGGAAAAAILLDAGAAAVARRAKINKDQKQACESVFAVFAESVDDLPRKLPAALREQLARDHALSDDQIDRQYGSYCQRGQLVGSSSSRAAHSPTAASEPAASSARAAPSAGAAGAAEVAPAPKRRANAAGGAHYIDDEQRAVMTAVFAAQAPSWGFSLPTAAYVNPSSAQTALMELMAKTGLARNKLIYHYGQFRQQHHRPLANSLSDRRAELNERLELDKVLSAALVLPASTRCARSTRR